jgi:hypothetical protein
MTGRKNDVHVLLYSTQGIPVSSSSWQPYTSRSIASGIVSAWVIVHVILDMICRVNIKITSKPRCLMSNEQ